jgi:NitT/TauT family transport system permease protein
MRAARHKLVGVAVFLLLWEAACRAGLVDPLFVPPPSVVLVALVHCVGDPEFRTDAASTVLSWFIAVSVATVIGVALGLLLGSLPRLRAAGLLVVEFLRPMPGVVLIPLVIALIGIDAQTKIALATFTATWPVLFNTIYALGDVEPQLLEMARSYRTPRWRSVVWVTLPAIVPHIVTGIRFALSVALISLVSTEFLTGGGIGLGQFINVSGSGAGRMDLVLAGAVFAGTLGLLADAALNGAAARLLPWAPNSAVART